MAKVTLEIRPPLSRKVAPAKELGSFVLEEEIDQGETLRDLLVRVASRDSKAWVALFDVQTLRMARNVLTIFNGRSLTPSKAVETRLSDDDRIVFLGLLSGG